ncbi:valyl-tRNA synthetase [Mycoplasma testudineum]|uniref:Valine--tRNA ligase n=1 Tax=Mycoplasma testudineum TaxID=244584 RepID=A0A4R6IER3_9MOLU|nr:valine--tRNA ligase [Mycoplasma testudineum]OYD26573.1 valine--tRNA ligase [Mycoplasma testudineum]TDO19405.1 valyl-tRNA synthetase [Mycoplasma testudineum]
MNSKYDHILVEKGKNEKWVSNGYFSTHDKSKKPFSILLPPPNITGKLHIGHALNTYLQDTVIRYKKLQNFDVFWISGTDHAGIATQVKVEQKLALENETKHDLGREKFIDLTMKWKDEYQNIIHEQWAKLGLALDYKNERFTLDDKANLAVNKVFIDLYNKGIIYRDYRGVNWDPKQKTTLSNMEVYNKDVEQKMYYIKYYFEDQKKSGIDFIISATTRTETLFSNVALTVHPDDDRYKHLINLNVINPIDKRVIPILADKYIDPNFGTGVMKVSAHAINDIEIIKQNNLEVIESIDESGIMNEAALNWKGKDRFTARKEIGEFLKNTNQLEKEETTISAIGHSERTGTPIEILAKKQWFVDVKRMSNLVLDHLKTDDKLISYPARFEKDLVRWMEESYDWEISRQLWWGHRIPAWYNGDEIKVQVESPGKNWIQDEDVLDTWFSSGIAPYSFLGWPSDLENLERYLPTDLLVTGYDILFFWVARMYFLTLEFQNKKPFKAVLYHGLVRDEQRRKMSKSLGNGIDPMQIIDSYGSDALRWFLTTNTTAGMDITYSEEKIRAGWNFCNKIWNIARYLKLQNDDESDSESKYDLWIESKLSQLENNISNYIDKYEFTLIGKDIYSFVMDDFSSAYLEFLKVRPSKKFSLKIFKNLLVVLHPFLPFLTDHIYKELFNEELLESRLNKLSVKKIVPEVDDLIEIIARLREKKQSLNFSSSDQFIYWMDTNSFDETDYEAIDKLVKAKKEYNNGEIVVSGKYEINILIPENVKDEIIKNKKIEIDRIKSEISRAENILKNEQFLAKAPAKKIQDEKEKLSIYKEQLKALLND